MAVIKRKIVKKKTGKKVVKKTNRKRSKKTKVSEADNVFRETHDYWKSLVSEINSVFCEMDGVLSLIEELPQDKRDKDNLMNIIKIVKRLIKESYSNTNKLEESLWGIDSFKPVDEIEVDVIGAVRALRDRRLGKETYTALMPLFKSAKRVGYSFPEWYKNCVQVCHIEGLED